MSASIDITRLPHSVELEYGQGFCEFSYIDERELPGKLVIACTQDWHEVVCAIKTLAVRGAPAIGLAGAAAVALWACEMAGFGSGDVLVGARAIDDGYLSAYKTMACEVAQARPTAVNLSWAVERMSETLDLLDRSATRLQVAERFAEKVRLLQTEDERTNHAIGENGAALLKPGSRILTHCKAGSLGTYHFGTALGVVYQAAIEGKIDRVYADETRPVGQGARLTVWELSRVGVPVTLLCDNMAASIMAQGLVDAVIVGADRIARNGDVANKIGTYGVALLAHAHGVPFYVAAPTSTLDLALEDGSGIVIEQRSPEEVLPTPIEGVDVINPAFDITPARYITAIITEKWVREPSMLSD